jgi:ribosome-associated protein
MRPVCTYTDFFVIATGRNSRQTAAIWNEGLLPRSVDGEREATWIIGDFLDVVLHVFTPDQREYYRLEDLWDDVPSVEVEAVAG